MIQINLPPDDCRCEICGKHASELERDLDLEILLPNDWDDMGGIQMQWRSHDRKLFKNYREDLPGCISSFWECKDCILFPDEEAFNLQANVAKRKDNKK